MGNRRNFVGLFKATGHPLEEPLSQFLLQNEQWISAQGATMSFRIAQRPWAEAQLLVTPLELRTEVNRRLVAAGFKTNLPERDRHLDGHFMDTAVTIEILGLAKGTKAGGR